MNWLPLQLRRQTHLATIMFKVINGIAPPSVYGLFNYCSGSRSSEQCNLAIDSRATTREFKHLGAKCWNDVPTSIRESLNVNSFRKRYKSILLETFKNKASYDYNNVFDSLLKIS